MQLAIKTQDAVPTVASELARAGVKNVAPFEGILMPFPLRDYQVEGLNKALMNQRFGLYFEPRLGKTIVFMLSAIYCAHYEVRTILMVPPVLFLQLQEEWARFGNNPFKMQLFNQGPAVRNKLVQGWEDGSSRLPDILLMTQQIFIKERTRLSKWFPQIIWDECHIGLQKSATKIYSALWYHMRGSDTRLLLSTGTPIYTSATNAYPIISLTSPESYVSEALFDRTHIVTKPIKVMNRRGREVMIDVPHSIKNTALLYMNLYARGIRKTRIGTLSMKAPDVAIHDVKLYPAHQKLYDGLVRKKILENGSTVIKATNASKLRQMAGQIVLSPQVFTTPPMKDNAVLDAADAIMKQFPEEERFVLVAHYNHTVETLAERYKELKPRVIYGGDEARSGSNAKNAEEFKSGNYKLLVMNADSGGVGLTLGHVCSVMIIVEPLSSYGKFDQTVSRLLLIDKKEPVTVYILKPLGTVWVRAVQLMLDRTAVLRNINQDSNDLLSELTGH